MERVGLDYLRPKYELLTHLPDDQRETVHNAFQYLSCKYFKKTYFKYPRGRPWSAITGIAVRCSKKLTWQSIDDNVKTPLEKKMLEMMFKYQFEYMCKRCSRVKSWSSREEINNFDRNWHKDTGAKLPCPFCDSETDAEQVKKDQGTVSEVFTKSKHQYATFKGTDGKLPCLLDQTYCCANFSETIHLFKHYKYGHARYQDDKANPFLRALGWETDLI